MKYLALFAICLSFSGCSPGQKSFLVVQICLGDSHNLMEFTHVLKSISEQEHLEFIDDSSIDKANMSGLSGQRDPIISLSVEHGDGAGLTATNIGLPGYQVGIGFTEGDDASWAHAFANRVLNRLKANWHVEVVPPKMAAFPLPGCSQ